MFRSVCCLLLFFAGFAKADYYVDEAEGKCYSTNKTYLCAKYKILKFVDSYNFKNFNLTSDSSVKFVDIPGANMSDTAIFPKSRHYSREDTEFGKVFKFLQRQADRIFNQQGLSIELPDEVKIVEEQRENGSSRGKKKKMLILPILILIKLCKIKMIVSLILAGVMFIKKILLIGAFILPGVVAAIKAHCKAQQYHVVPYQVDEDHYTHDHEHEDPSGYGISGYGFGGDKHHYWDRINKKRHSFL